MLDKPRIFHFFPTPDNLKILEEYDTKVQNMASTVIKNIKSIIFLSF